MSRRPAAELCMLIACLSGRAPAGTIYVNGATGNDAWSGRCEIWDGGTCGPKRTIQAGINVASVGEQVLIADGTYSGTGNKNLDFGGKRITVRSASGSAGACIIDCGGYGRGFWFHSGEPLTALVDGLTVRNGYRDCQAGGAVSCDAGKATFTNCVFSDNEADQAEGGAVFIGLNCDVRLTNCTISRNRATYGGGVFCYACMPTLTSCTIAGNTADGANSLGGGICCHDAGAFLVDCTITDNSTAGAAGGGGMYLDGCEPLLVNCLIARNTAMAAAAGGGIACISATPYLTNCTILGNTAGASGGGLSCASSSSPTLTNCIVWANTPPQFDVASGAPIVTYSAVQGGWSGIGNIDADPHFAFAGDFHLLPDSPCIDAGTNEPPDGLTEHDLDGNPRPLDGEGGGGAVADIGAYEFAPAVPTIALDASELMLTLCESGSASATVSIRNSGAGALAWTLESDADWVTVEPAWGESAGEIDTVTVTVNLSELGTHSTTLWLHAPGATNDPRPLQITARKRCARVPEEYPTIQAAINAAMDGDEVVLADGVYTGPGNAGFRFDYYMDTDKAITVRSASDDPAACIVDCGGDQDGVVFYLAEAVPVVRGLTFRDGRWGAYACGCAGRLSNCVLTGNSLGAAMYMGSLELVTCRVAANSGRGVYCYDSSWATLTNCLIAGNTGGGVACYDQSGATLVNCVLVGNSAAQGAATYDDCSGLCGYNTNLINCTITGNEGGGLRAFEINNCIVWGNTSPQICGAMSASYSDIEGGWSGLGVADIQADPLFVRLPTAGDYGDLRLRPNSPCTDAGANAYLPADTYDIDGDGDATEKLPFDLSRQPRFHDDSCTPDTGSGTPPIVDIGAYEYQGVTCARGDLNCDGSVNAFDIDPFVSALTSPAAYAEQFPSCDYMLADCNGDGYVNAFDIDPFVRLLTGTR